jgi:hypothetical protein
VGGSGSAPRRDARAALRDHHPRVPRAPRAVAALRRSGGARLSARHGLRAREPDRCELPAGPALR